MNKLNELLKKNNIKAHRYEKEGKVTIVDSQNTRYVYKEKIIDKKILNYLKTRNFNYIPKMIDDRLYIYEEDYQIPKEQKMIDLIKLIALLHSKTTHYIEVDNEYFEKRYDNLDNNIKHLYSYYTDLITIIETKVYPSPSEQLLSRNISKIYETISNSKKKLDNWHTSTKDKTKTRKVVIHNNLDISHFIRNEKLFLISWEKSKIASPIIDIYKLYQNHILDFDFESILKIYENNYPLLKEEKELFYTLVSIPDKIELKGSEYDRCKKISHMLDKIYKAEKLISPKTFKK